MQMKRSFIRTTAVAAMFALGIMTAALQARGAETEVRVVSTGQLKAMLDAKKDFTLIDARTTTEYADAHIVGAISIPENKFEESLNLLPADKNKPLVFYCNGVKCGKSKKAAAKAVTAGFKNITIYNEGFPVWEEKKLNIVAGPEYGKKVEAKAMSPAELAKLIDNKNKEYVLVDVREEVEYRQGHIPGAINIPVDVFAARSVVLPKEKQIIVYCNTGVRSYAAYRKLMRLAYPSMAEAKFVDWKDAGYPVEK